MSYSSYQEHLSITLELKYERIQPGTSSLFEIKNRKKATLKALSCTIYPQVCMHDYFSTVRG